MRELRCIKTGDRAKKGEEEGRRGGRIDAISPLHATFSLGAGVNIGTRLDRIGLW